MPSHFHQPGLDFAYPDNWAVEPAGQSAAVRSVTVLSPGTAFWTASIYPPERRGQQLVETAVAALGEEYRELEVEEICEEYAGRKMAGCDIHFQYLDLTSTASVRWFVQEGRVYLLMWQAEDREYDALSPVFEAMTVSLLQGLESR